MRFASTRGKTPEVSFSQALLQGLAPDGGLYVPQQWPDLAQLVPGDLPSLGRQLIGAFAVGDALADAVPAITSDAFNFPAPLKALTPSGRLRVLELFHGPHRGIQGFRRALSRGQPGQDSARLRTDAAHPGGDVGRQPAVRLPRPFIAAPAWKWWCCSPRDWSRPRSSSSSPAGATTSPVLPCAAPSTTASGW